MRNALWAAAILAIPALVLVGCQPAEEPETAAPAEPTDEEVLHQLTTAFETAWGAADATAIAALWTENGDSTTLGVHSKGRAAVEESYQQGFAGPYKGTTIDVDMTSVRFVQPDLAIADGTYTISGLEAAEGADVLPAAGMWMNVSVKVEGQWLIASSRPMVPLEAPAAEPGSEEAE
jgi:uncharacterized protein (TIGR02246 family)